MKKYLKEIEVYSYNELEGKARNRVNTMYFDSKVDCDADYFKDYVREDLKEKWGVTDLEMYYSLTYSQGDGVCLDGYVSFADILANENLRKAVVGDDRLAYEVKENEKVLRELLDGFQLTHSGSYYHANMVYIEPNDDPYPDEYTDDIKNIIIELWDYFKDWYFERCREYEKVGYKMFYEYSDDDVKEWIEANDYAFDEYGDLVGCYADLKEVA